MLKLINQLAAAADVPAFTADTAGRVLFANEAAEEEYPFWEGTTLTELMPEFFAEGVYRPDYRYFGSHHDFDNHRGQELEMVRFQDLFLCRIFSVPVKEQLSESGVEDELEQIRFAVLSITRVGSSLEDTMLDKNSQDPSVYIPVTDHIYESDVSCRRVILSCNRLEAQFGSPDRYPPQEVDLNDAITRLVLEVRTALPGLKYPVRAQLPDEMVSARANWPLLRRVILEAARCSAAAAGEREGSMVFGITLSADEETAIIVLSDNYSGIPSPQDHRGGLDSPYSSWLYIHNLVQWMGGTLSETVTPYGDRALEIRLERCDDEFLLSGRVIAFHAENSYRVQERITLSDPLIYLEKFSE